MRAAHLPRGTALHVLMVLAAVDWAMALGWTVTGARRHVSVPLLIAAASVLLGSQWSRHAHLVAEVRGAPRRGVSRWTAAEAVLAQQWSPRVAALVLREPRLLWSVVLLVRGSRDGAPAATFSAHRDPLPVWLALGGVALVEVALTPLLPVPGVVETALVVLGVWGLVLVVGLIAALVVHPHVVGERYVRVRFGFWDEVAVPRSAITTARATRQQVATRGLDVADGCASVSPGGVTNVQLELNPPVAVRGVSVDLVRLWADAPHAFASACTSESRPA